MLLVSDIARRLPHSERRLVLDLIDEKRKNFEEERDVGGRLLAFYEEPSRLKTSDPLAKYLELSVNPSFVSRISRRMQAMGIWLSGRPLGSRQALWEAQERYRASEEILRER